MIKKFIHSELLFSSFILFVIILGCSKSKDYSDMEIDQLKSLPYASWSSGEVDVSVSGVTTNIEEKVYPGYNLYFNLKDRAYLMANSGEIVHTWFMPYHYGQWEYGYLKPDGNLVAYAIDLGVTEIDWESNPVWYTEMRAHHDVEILPDGSYLVPDTFVKQYNGRNVLFNSVRHISKKGELLDEWSTWDHFEELQKYHLPTVLDEEPGNPEETPGEEFDYYHLNTIKLLPANKLGKKDIRFQEGNWLICFRNVSLVIILDKDTKAIVWNWGPDDLDWPHMPVMLENGDILIFDNGATKNKFSRILQFNPVTKEITWEFKTDPPAEFYSQHWGSAQRFPNGNTLIADSASGHIFEVTEKKNIVWEFYNDDIQVDKRKRIYRMIRYPADMVDNLLAHSSEKKFTNGYLRNAGFENADTLRTNVPAAWKYSAWIYDKSEFTWDSDVSRTGNRSVKIVFDWENVGYWGQLVRVDPNSTYRLSGWVKTRDVPSSDSDNYEAGVFLSAKNDDDWPAISELISGTKDWTELSCEFNTGNHKYIEIQCMIGSNGVEIKGTAWFDDIKLEKIE